MTMRSLVLSVVVFASVAGVSGSAKAIDVTCESDEGTCTVSNDPVDFLTCECGDAGGTAGTGADSWADLSEDELFDICVAELAVCAPGPDTDSTTIGTTFGTDTDSTDTGDTESPSTTDVGSSDTGGSASGTADTGSDTTDPGTSSGGDTSGGSEEGTSGGGSESVTAGEATATATESASASDSDDTSSGSASAGGDGEDVGGCGCSAGSEDRSGVLGLAMVAIAGLRVRRRR